MRSTSSLSNLGVERLLLQSSTFWPPVLAVSQSCAPPLSPWRSMAAAHASLTLCVWSARVRVLSLRRRDLAAAAYTLVHA